jgi:ribosomal protein L32
MRLYQRPRQIQNTQENHGLMMSAKMPSNIAKKPNDGSENMQHRTTSEIFASSGQKLEGH